MHTFAAVDAITTDDRAELRDTRGREALNAPTLRFVDLKRVNV
jgi:hypothetical protein